MPVMPAMPIMARRVFRVSLTMALSLTASYALSLPLPYMAPLFAIMLTATPAPPMRLKGLLGLLMLIILTLGSGLLLIPVLLNYPVTAVLLVAAGLYLSSYITVNLGKGLVGTFLTVGFTSISAAGTVDYAIALTVIQALALGVSLAICCQWIVYPWFPENPGPPAARPVREDAEKSNWIALRATLIVLPAYLLALTNPLAYMPIILKSVSLGQQGDEVEARNAGREMLGSTLLGGLFAVAFWFALKLQVNLWMFFLWTLLFGIYFSSKIYRIIPTRFAASFWVNTAVTMLILLGPAVEDSVNGKDVYKAFAVRMGLFVAVALYASIAIHVLDHLWRRRHARRTSRHTPGESQPC